MWISKQEYNSLVQGQTIYNRYSRSLEDRIDEMWGFWRDNVYGKWEVVATVKHPDGTVVETAQRIVKKAKRD